MNHSNSLTTVSQSLSSSSKDLEKEGRSIYQSNEHYHRLANFMEHPEFREFYKTYMKDWESTKVIIMFMKIYESIEKSSKDDHDLSPYQKIAIVKQIIEDSELRPIVCQQLLNYTSTNNTPPLLEE